MLSCSLVVIRNAAWAPQLGGNNGSTVVSYAFLANDSDDEDPDEGGKKPSEPWRPGQLYNSIRFTRKSRRPKYDKAWKRLKKAHKNPVSSSACDCRGEGDFGDDALLMASFEPFNGPQETFQIWSSGKSLRAIKLTDPGMEDEFSKARQEMMMLNRRMSEEEEDVGSTGAFPDNR